MEICLMTSKSKYLNIEIKQLKNKPLKNTLKKLFACNFLYVIELKLRKDIESCQ